MNREDIIRMAREAGFTNPEKFTTTDENLKGILSDFWENLERFAALVAAAEREACAGVVEEEASRWAVPVTSADYREMWDECAAAIRARGNT